MVKALENYKQHKLVTGRDPREVAAYSIADAARYLGIPVSRLHAWVRGKDYKTASGIQRSKPLIELPDRKKPELSFINLIEAHVLDGIRYKHSVPLPSVKRALAYLEKNAPTKHPLADEWFHSDGKNLFIEKYGQIINISEAGQLMMRVVIEAYLKRVERDLSGKVVRLFPFTNKQNPIDSDSEPKVIVIDPLVSFGKPTLAGSGIPTSVIAERFNAGDSIHDLAEDYDREESEIEKAIRYETSSRAA